MNWRIITRGRGRRQPSDAHTRTETLTGEHGGVCLVAAGGHVELPAPRLSLDYEAARSWAARAVVVAAAARGEVRRGGADQRAGPG